MNGILLSFHLLIRKSMYLIKKLSPAHSVEQELSKVNSATSVLQRKTQAVLSLLVKSIAEKLFPMHKLSGLLKRAKQL